MYTSSIIKEERTVCRAYEQHLIDKVLGRIVKKKKNHGYKDSQPGLSSTNIF